MWYAALMGSRDEKVAENQALFREMNARLASWEERREAPTERHLFFCECGERACHERVCLTIGEYASVREHPMRFAVLPGHVRPEIERAVEEHERYVVVEKHDRFRYVVERVASRWGANPDGATRRRS